MSYGYNTSVNQTKNTSYNYNPNVMPNTSVSSGNSNFNYSEIYSSDPHTSAKSTRNRNPKNSATGPWGITMGQAQNFTLYIKGICEADNAFTLLSKNGRFLPLKSLDFKPVALEHMRIRAGVFSDLPFFHRRKLGTLNCVTLDSSKSLISQRLFQWYNSCVYTKGYVPYVDEMCRDVEYIEYTHDGKVAVKYGFSVIPDNDITVGRTYESDSGSLTEYKFSLVIVSDIHMAGNGGKWVEADWGDGGGPDADYERRVYGTVYNLYGNGTSATINDPAISDYL